MFRREVYRAMEPILLAIDGRTLSDHGFALGGATRIALAFGEPRASADLDFVGSDARGFAALRADVRERGYAALFRDSRDIELPREPRSDQYGIRFPVKVGERLIKIEIIHEGRVALEAPVLEPGVPVPCLSIRDCFLEKLLANSDRGADPSQLHRDLVDLATLRRHVGPIPDSAWALARAAYGDSVYADLAKSIQRFRRDEQRRRKDLERLGVEKPSEIEDGVEMLARDLRLSTPERDE